MFAILLSGMIYPMEASGATCILGVDHKILEALKY
jgi:hypothetical protein